MTTHSRSTTTFALRFRLTVALALCLLRTLALPAHAQTPGAFAPVSTTPPGSQRRAVVQIAILLDTSNSMDGLIAQAKAELWRIVNEIGSYQKNGAPPLVQVALYEYGKQSLSAESGFIRQVSPFTTDLDQISEALFGLTTNGGDEFCGQVIDRAVGELNWSRDPDDFRAIFIAGNEPFTQGHVDFHKSVAKATARHVAINTIHCGGYQEGAQTGWAEGARLGGGAYLSIDPNQKQVHVATPFDDEIIKKSDKLSGTYVGYGKSGAMKKERQAVQDSNAKVMGGGSAVARASTKAKANVAYNNADWDMVDAQAQGKLDAAAVATEDLPAEMKAMAPAERKAFIGQKQAEREKLQKEVAELERKRQAYEQAERAKHAVKDKNTFDSAVRGALEGQLTKGKWSRAPAN